MAPRRMSDFFHVDPSRQWQADLIDAIQQNNWIPNDSLNLTSFSDHISSATAKQRGRQLEAQLLKQLSFRDLSDRQNRIAEAHIQTFQWIFHGPAEQQGKPWCNLVTWLEGDGDLYWITGKAGSGKSTLMKYMYRDPRTRQHLRVWAGSLPLVTASFYFWNSGSQVQMSQLGLIRSILYEALKQRPSLLPVLFHQRWSTSSLFGEDIHPWTLSELMKAFNLLVLKSDKSFKLCLFID